MLHRRPPDGRKYPCTDVGGDLKHEHQQAFDNSRLTTLFGDQLIGYGAWAWAERASQAGKSPVYRYYFTRRPPGAPELSINPLSAPGVYHSAELYYVFDNLKVRDWPWAEDDRRLAQAMSSYFVNFAKTGSPNGKDLPQWPNY